MIKPDKNFIHSDLTETIIGCAYDVYNQLGFGFLEKVYENAMMIKLPQKGLMAVQQAPIKVYFEGKLVGDFLRIFLTIILLFLNLKRYRLLLKPMRSNS